MRLLCFWAVALPLVLGGCGLTLDLQPPDDGGGIGFDAKVRSDGSTARACGTSADCDDGNRCNGAEVCVSGRCASGTPLVCDDGTACTNDSCSPDQGCVHAPDDTLCADDGIACTIERCDPSGGCQRDLSHAACNDGIACTSDVCDPTAGCGHEAVDTSCGMGVCDPSTGCMGTECVTDGDCTADPCDMAVHCVRGICVHTSMADGATCDDGNPCTDVSTCSGGTCAGTEVTTCAGQPCWVCDPAGPGCDGSSLQPRGTTCSDGNLCTQGDACTEAGVCEGTHISCIDTNPCTMDSCDPTAGCVYVPATGRMCNDDDPCTHNDMCRPDGTCAGVSPCDDGNPCTHDCGYPPTYCTHMPVTNGTLCNDGDPCTTGETCQIGDCRGEPTCPSSTCAPQACTGGTCTMLPPPSTCSHVICTGTPGTCTCVSGWSDCDGDGICECAVGTGLVMCSPAGSGTARTCNAIVDCTVGATDCPPLASECCPCTGVCYDPAVPEACTCP